MVLFSEIDSFNDSIILESSNIKNVVDFIHDVYYVAYKDGNYTIITIGKTMEPFIKKYLL
jgi:hypothetical protein